MPAATKTSVSGRQALIDVLTKEGKAMKSKALCAEAMKRATGLKGKSPAATLSAVLSVSAGKSDGEFIRVAPGEFDLRSRVAVRPAKRKRPNAVAVAVSEPEPAAEVGDGAAS